MPDTAHHGRSAGIELGNLLKNPSLHDLIGGIQSVTLSDEEARRRGVQKSVLERAAAPTFDVAVEILERHRWRVHTDVGYAVDELLRGRVRPCTRLPLSAPCNSIPLLKLAGGALGRWPSAVSPTVDINIVLERVSWKSQDPVCELRSRTAEGEVSVVTDTAASEGDALERPRCSSAANSCFRLLQLTV